MANESDFGLVETNLDLVKNIEQIKKSSKTFEKEMQVKFSKVNERARTLAYYKQRMVEDLNFTLKTETKNLVDY